MKTVIETRLQGDKEQYYLLSVYKEGQKYPIVHTSKNLNYLKKMVKERYK